MIRVFLHRLSLVLPALLVAVACPADDTPPCRTAVELSRLDSETCSRNVPFVLEGQLTAALSSGHYLFADATTNIHVRNHSNVFPPAGSLVRLRGVTELDSVRQRQFTVTSINTLDGAIQPPPAPAPATIASILARRHDYTVAEVSGIVADIFHDDVDPKWMYLTLLDKARTLTVALPAVVTAGRLPQDLLNTRVRLVGAVLPDHASFRHYIGPHLELTDTSVIDVIDGNSDDPFDVPPLEDLTTRTPTEILSLGPRTLTGRVLACQGNGRILLESGKNAYHTINLINTDDLPAAGSTIQVMGRPATDLYHINLTHARYRQLTPPTPDAQEAARENPAKLFLTGNGRSCVNMYFHGRLLCFTGTVLTLAPDRQRAVIDCEGVGILLDFTAVPDLIERLVPGSVVRFTGIGFAETENWHAGATFPTINAFSILARTPEDLVILRTAPWWTPMRRNIALGLLFAVLLGLIIWNRVLKRLVEKRSRQLYQKEFARSAAVLRTQDRTRLAVELHDSLSQTLTGVALQVDAVIQAAQLAPDQAAPCAIAARRMVDNCRSELKNCLWDLRNQALDEPNALEAIRKTVSPQAGDAELTIDFAIPRKRFSDVTFHDILRILRELVANAVRHGQARHIAITGRETRQTIEISVADDGTGFDPAARPGISDGHFGLDGISERLKRKGTLAVTSQPGRGTSVTVTLNRSQT